MKEATLKTRFIESLKNKVREKAEQMKSLKMIYLP